MKKSLLLLLILAAYSFRAQITFEKTYPNATCQKDYLRLVKLSNAGYKYVTTNTTSINLYNLNHSLYQSIATPSANLAFGQIPLNIMYISDQLFDTNPATIEYLWAYIDNSGSHVKVFDQAGNILFSKDSVGFYSGAEERGEENFITYTPVGVKMILYNTGYGGNNAQAYANVYALPGILPCHDCSNGVITSMQAPGGTINPRLINYPNPSSEQTTIEYELPKGQSNGEIVFYNETGTETKRFKVTDTFHNIVVSVADLEAGVYFYQLETTSGFKATKKMVVIK